MVIISYDVVPSQNLNDLTLYRLVLSRLSRSAFRRTRRPSSTSSRPPRICLHPARPSNFNVVSSGLPYFIPSLHFHRRLPPFICFWSAQYSNSNDTPARRITTSRQIKANFELHLQIKVNFELHLHCPAMNLAGIFTRYLALASSLPTSHAEWVSFTLENK